MQPPAARSRPRLTRTAVIAAAVDLADRDGIDALTMRKLAQAIGVEAMSLYHHVANKDDLLDGMVDAVFSEITAPRAGEPFRPELKARCESLRAALLRHPWAVGRLDSRRSPGLATLQHHEAVLACLRADGFDVRATALAFATIDAFVYGFAVQELSLPIETGDDAAELATEIFESVDQAALPHLAEIAFEHASRADYAFANEFGPGLDLVLDGIDRLRSAHPR